MNQFSIIIPTYNRGTFLLKTIESVINQTYLNWELIIIDDGSTDNTKQIIEGIPDPRIKYFYQENAERSAARNNGIKHSSGEWICFLDSDDYYLPNHLQLFNEFILNNSPEPCFLLAGGYEEKNTELVEKPLYKLESGIHPARFIFESTSVTPISVCIHKKCFDKHLFVEKYKKSYWEDTHLWIRLTLEFPFYQLNEFTNVLAEHLGRSVNSKISMERVNDHVDMIKHLFTHYSDLVNKVFSQNDLIFYCDRKYRMFLYQARQNKQLVVSVKIWFRGMINRPSIYLISELPKIFLNQFNIGIHGK